MVEDAWAEVRAIAVDLGVDWPKGSSRQVAAVLGRDLESSAAAELTGLAVVVERSRYSGEEVAPDGVADSVGVVSRALTERWGEPTAWVRRWWPRSLWPQRPSS
jgi:hypothetical protein